MAVPALAVQVQGQSVVGADNFNTYVQGAVVADNLVNFIGLDGMMCQVAGYSTPNDGGQGVYYWSSTATGPGNGTSIIMPFGVTTGAWLRTGYMPATGTNFAPGDPTGTSSLGGVMAGLAMTYTPILTGNVLVTLTGNGANTTIDCGYAVGLRTAAGTPPVNGASLTGGLLASNSADILPAAAFIPFSLTYYVTGLAIGVSQWFDLAQYAIAGGAASLTSIRMSLIEI